MANVLNTVLRNVNGVIGLPVQAKASASWEALKTGHVAIVAGKQGLARIRATGQNGVHVKTKGFAPREKCRWNHVASVENACALALLLADGAIGRHVQAKANVYQGNGR